MNFTLSEEHRLIQQTAYQFAVKEFGPLAQECDREEKFPKELIKKACEVGLVGTFIPQEYGGQGYGFFEVALITEQISRVDVGLGMSAVLAPTFGSENILFFGTEEQKKKYLTGAASGRILFAGAYTEPDAGTDIVAARTTAIREGNEYVINGSKMFITNGTVCDCMVTFCMTNPKEESKYRRHSLILIEANRDGIAREKIKGKLGIRASDTAEISFADVRVPCDNLIGEEGKGFYHLMHFFDVTRTMVGAQGVGLAQGALDKTLPHVKKRKTFGQPLASYQSIQFLLAEMATRIELARTMVYRAAWSVDQGQMNPTINAMAKYFAGETAVWVCDKALQMHGGYGLIDEYDVQRFYRDAKVIEIVEGVKEAEKMTIAKSLLR
jgi:alkylation response protein AidB-like acyl-CoA dehydrogenase